MHVLVVGGTLFIGRALVDELISAGHQVTVLHRNPGATLPEGVNSLIADRNDPDAVRSVLAGHRFEAVFDNVYDWQRGTTAEQVEATALACARDTLERYVFMSSVGAFPLGLDHLDNDPLVGSDDPNDYARNKANSERTLFSLHERHGFPAVTLRPPFVYGPGNPFYREAFFWDRIRDQRPIIIPDDGRRLMQFVFVGDLVRACLRILAVPDAAGKSFNIADRPAITQMGLVEVLAHVAAAAAKTVFLPREKALAAGGHPMGPKMYFAQYYDLPSITMRTDNMTDVLGIVPMALEEGLRTTYKWWLNYNPFPKPDYRFEDQLLGL
jgi:nucleoside-diphosphate-sugar epimerase